MSRLLPILMIATAVGCTVQSPAESLVEKPPSLPLLASPETIDFGTVQQGSKHERELTITNVSDQPVRIARIKTSCDCVTLEIADDEIPAREQTQATLRLDLSHEPEFVGNVMVNVAGFAHDCEVFAVDSVVDVILESHGVGQVEHEGSLHRVDCGPRSLCIVARLASMDVPLEQLYEKMDIAPHGVSLLQIKNAAVELGFNVDAAIVSFSELDRRLSAAHSYAILYGINRHFFVALAGDLPGTVYMVDPLLGVKQVDARALESEGQRKGHTLFLWR